VRICRPRRSCPRCPTCRPTTAATGRCGCWGW
jgi:hypothetical protein